MGAGSKRLVHDWDALLGWGEMTGSVATFNMRYELAQRERDAADVAISMTFGPNTLQLFRVWTDEVQALAA